MSGLSGLVYLLLGLRPSGGSGRPCFWCGVRTDLLDAERLHVCAEHQIEEAAIGFFAMKKKYRERLH